MRANAVNRTRQHPRSSSDRPQRQLLSEPPSVSDSIDPGNRPVVFPAADPRSRAPVVGVTCDVAAAAAATPRGFPRVSVQSIVTIQLSVNVSTARELLPSFPSRSSHRMSASNCTISSDYQTPITRRFSASSLAAGLWRHPRTTRRSRRHRRSAS